MSKYPFIKQYGLKDCGVACLSMLIEYYGGFINYERLVEMTKTTKSGTSAYNLVETLKQVGFNSYGIHYELSKDVSNFNLPAIAHTIIDNSYNHFIVIYEINCKKEYLVIADPATKIKKISFEEFRKIYNNIILIAYPIRKIEKERKILLKEYVKKIIMKKNILILFLESIFIYLISILFIFLMRYLLKNSVNTNMVILVLIIILIKFFLNYIKNNYLIKIKKQTNFDLLNESFTDVLLLPYSYYRNHTTGEIMSRLNDIDNIKEFVEIYIAIITNILFASITAVLLILINKILFIITIFILLLYLINYFHYSKKIMIKLDNLKQSKSLMNSYMTESILGFESIKGQNLEPIFKEKFISKSKDYLDTLKEYEKIEQKMNIFNGLISDLSIFLVLIIGFILINNNILDYADLMVYYTFMNYFLEPIKNVIQLSLITQDIKLSLKRLLNLKYVQHKKKKIINGHIKLNNVNFKINEKNIITSLNIDINKAEKVMLVGSSGCGKSTVLKLLKQYYKTKNIYIDKKNINEFNLKDNITYVSQDEYLFTDTLYNNIVMNRNISDENLDKIIDICCLRKLIDNNPLGMNMLIEENGFNLSGGEKQRIIIARALINIKDYLFIDEGLSEVDISLERKILKNIFKNYRDKTIIFVSHRSDNIDLFDKLIKLDEKEVLKKGDKMC